MKRTLFLTAIIAALVYVGPVAVNAQSLPVTSHVLNDYYRTMQLAGKTDSNISFTVRPLSATALKVSDIFDPDSISKSGNWIKKQSVLFDKGRGQFKILPFTWQQQLNSNHPYGWNYGAMIAAKG